jgi:hypothetical protein
VLAEVLVACEENDLLGVICKLAWVSTVGTT